MKPRDTKKFRHKGLRGEYKAVKKLNKVQRYLSNGLERYQDIIEVPEAPKGIEYRNMGTQESQIFSKLEKKFCSGRKAFSEHGANALAKICVISEKFRNRRIRNTNRYKCRRLDKRNKSKSERE